MFCSIAVSAYNLFLQQSKPAPISNVTLSGLTPSTHPIPVSQPTLKKGKDSSAVPPPTALPTVPMASSSYSDRTPTDISTTLAGRGAEGGATGRNKHPGLENSHKLLETYTTHTTTCTNKLESHLSTQSSSNIVTLKDDEIFTPKEESKSKDSIIAELLKKIEHLTEENERLTEENERLKNTEGALPLSNSEPSPLAEFSQPQRARSSPQPPVLPGSRLVQYPPQHPMVVSNHFQGPHLITATTTKPKL